MKAALFFISILINLTICIQTLFATDDLKNSTLEKANNNPKIDSCIISNVRTEVYECPQTISYDIEITFSVFDAGENGYTILFDNDTIFLGGYTKEDSLQSIIIGPINCSRSDYKTIKIFDNEFDYCMAVQPMTERIDCDQLNCKISNVLIKPQTCDSLNRFAMDISFDYENVDVQGFSIFANETNIGNFKYSELDSLGYVTTKPIEADKQTEWIIKVEDNRRCNCNQTYNIGTVNCTNLDCKIENLTTRIFCPGYSHIDDDLFIDFDYSNTQSSFFEVFLDNRPPLTFEFDELPLAHNFNSYADNVLVVEKGNPICFARASVLVELCLSVDEMPQFNIKIYQANDILMISDLHNIERINIFDLNGRIIYETEISKSNLTIPTQNFPKGINIVRLKSATHFISKKICLK